MLFGLERTSSRVDIFSRLTIMELTHKAFYFLWNVFNLFVHLFFYSFNMLRKTKGKARVVILEAIDI